MAVSSLNSTLGGRGRHSPDRLRKARRRANRRKRGDFFDDVVGATAGAAKQAGKKRGSGGRGQTFGQSVAGSQGRAKIRQINRRIGATQAAITRRQNLSPSSFQAFDVDTSTDTADLEARLARLRSRRARLASNVAERGQTRSLARHDTLLESVEKAAWFAPGIGVTGAVAGLAAKGAARLAAKKAAQELGEAAAKATSKTARTATATSRAERAATAGGRGRPAHQPRPSRPAGKYGQSSGTRGRATRRPSEPARPNPRTPNRATRGRSRRKVEAGYSRKPIRSRGRRTAQTGGAVLSAGTALDVAALSRGEDPEALETVGRVASGPFYVGKAFVEDPEVRKETLRAAKAIPREFLPGVWAAVSRPKATGESMLEQYKRTYEPLLEGDTEEFERRLAEPGSGGALGPAMDYSLIAGPIGSSAAGAAARRGALGSNLRKITTSERPDLRYGTGEGAAKHQDASGRLGKRVIQHRRDRARQRRQERRHDQREPGGEARATDALDPRQLEGNREVVPRHARTERRLSRREGGARPKGRGKVALDQARGALIKEYRDLEKSLTSEQKDALIPVLRGQVSADNPSLAAGQYRTIIREIGAERARRNARGQPVRGRTNNVEEYQRFLSDLEANGDAIYTPGFRAVAERMADIERRLAGKREELGELGTEGGGASQAELRRLKPSVEAAIREGELPAIEEVLGDDVRALEARVRELAAREDPEGKAEFDGAVAELNTARAVEPVRELQRAYDEVSEQMRALPANAEARAQLAMIRKSTKDALEKARNELFEDSTFGTYINRLNGSGDLAAAQKSRGVIDPAYVPSQRRLREQFSLAAIGGSRGLRNEQRYEGELFRTGREDLNPRVYLQGLEKSVKRAENLQLIASVAEQSGVPLTRLVAEDTIRKGLARVPGKDVAFIERMEPMAAVNELVRRKALREEEIPASLRRLEADAKDARGRIQGPMKEGRTAKEVLDDLDLLGIAEADVVLWNPERLFNDIAQVADTTDLEDALALGRTTGDTPLSAAWEKASIRSDLRATAGTHADPGWHAIPREVFEELQVIPGHFEKAARIFDITKGAYSRLLLGYGNISWLQFQVGANAFLTGLAGVGPLEAVRAQLWWRGLSEQERTALRPILNIQSNLLDVNKRSLGSTAGPFATRIRALRQTQFWQLARKVSPAQIADLAFAFDRKQTGFFRRAVLYDQVKKQAIHDMARETKGIVAAQERFLSHIYNTPSLKEQMLRVIENRRDLERHAESVDRMLGDYLTFTAKERATLQRFVMFYGFLRHSVQLALWTMPTRHPVTLGLISRLAILSDKERRDMLGIDDLPYGVAGIEFDTTPDGTGLMLNVARMSPVGNAIFEAPSPSSMLGVLPPAVSLPIQHFMGIKMFTGTPYSTEGRSVGQMYSDALTSGQTLGQLTDIGTHLRVFANEIESAMPPLRLYREIKFRGRQGDDASLIFGIFGEGARPTSPPKTEPARSSVAASEARDKARSPWTMVGQNLTGVKELSPEYAAFLRSREQENSESESSSSPGSSSGSGIMDALGIGSGSSTPSRLNWSSSSSSSAGGSGLIWSD